MKKMARQIKNKIEKPEGLQELGGWKLGDVAWGIRPNRAICRGEIVQFFEKEKLAQILCDKGNGYLICEISTLEETSTKSLMRKKAKEYIPRS